MSTFDPVEPVATVTAHTVSRIVALMVRTNGDPFDAGCRHAYAMVLTILLDLDLDEIQAAVDAAGPIPDWPEGKSRIDHLAERISEQRPVVTAVVEQLLALHQGAQTEAAPVDLDHCPTCGKRITDVDPDGCEAESGQRYCLVHLPRDADPDLYDAWQAHR